MWFGVLGPLYIRHGDAVLPVPAARQRILLAALLVQAGRAVSFDQLGDVVWDGDPPPSARATLRNYVKRTRQVLGAQAGARIVTRDPGYLIDVQPDEADLLQFSAMCTKGGHAVRTGSWREASQVLSEAVALWRGAAMADIRSEVLKEREVPRLEQLWLQAIEWRIEADLHLGGQAELVPELRALVAEHPWRERYHGQLMLALYRAGRQGEALATYRQAWRTLDRELGVEPGPELQRLHQRMLAADPDLTSPLPADREPPSAVAIRPPAEPQAGQAPGVPEPVVPRQLPAGVRHFSGRRDELRALDRLLDRPGRTAATV